MYKLKKAFLVILIGAFILSLSGFALAAQNVGEEDSIPSATGEEDKSKINDLSIETVAAGDMLHFAMDVKWGNVRGQASSTREADFDGSINVSTSTGRVSLIRTLLFDNHNDSADKIISEKNPVSWNSLIYSHWDGVRVLVSASALDSVLVSIAGIGINKTAKDFYESSQPIVQDMGDGREVVIKTYPAKNRHYFLKIFWGKVDKDADSSDSNINFSGSFNIDSGGKLKLIKTFRFETAMKCLRVGYLKEDLEAVKICRDSSSRDKILTHSKSEVSWQSYILGGEDGILVRLNLDKNVDANDTVTLKFNELDFDKTYSVLDLYHNRLTQESISSLGEGYGVILEVWRKPAHNLIRAKGKSTVYFIEDETARPIPSAAVFKANGFKWEDVEELSEEEVVSYPEGDALLYPDGSLIKGSSSTVYVVSEGKKKGFMSAKVFEGLGYKWGLIKNISDGELALYEIDDPLNENSDYPEGSLIRVEGTPTVWQIENGKKRPIPALSVFYAHKFDWQNVVVTDSTHGNKFSQGSELEYPDGSLISGPDGKVYNIDNGKKRWIRSALDFIKAGYNWDDIVTVSARDLSKYGSGNNIAGNDE